VSASDQRALARKGWTLRIAGYPTELFKRPGGDFQAAIQREVGFVQTKTTKTQLRRACILQQHTIETLHNQWSFSLRNSFIDHQPQNDQIGASNRLPTNI
jgi:hypothetical protein